MFYAIVGEDRPDSLADRLAARPAHLARLKALQDEGRMVLAGPCPSIDSPDPGAAGFSGSLIVAEFPSLVAAQAWADADPYVAAGVYANVAVKPFKKSIPGVTEGDLQGALRTRLAALNPLRVELFDDSAKHAGHAGARGGAHYRLMIVSPQFAGKSTLARHRLVYAALGELMHGRIHALGIEALAPGEVQ